MTTSFPTRLLPSTPLRIATVTLCVSLSGCTVVGDWFASDRADYKGASKRTQPLEVPPDLTQLQRDSRYLPQGGVVAASDLSKSGGTPPVGQPSVAGESNTASAPSTPGVALTSIGDLQIENQHGEHWLHTKQSPDVVLPKVREYWLSRGFTLKVDEPKTGILETDWAQNRTKLPGDVVKNFFGRFMDNITDSGLRDRYRTRLERQSDGSTDIFVTHFGATEEVTGFQKSDTQWVPRPSDPGLEAQQLSEMMLSLAGVANTNVAQAEAPKSDDGTPTRVIPSATVGGGANGGTGPNGTPRARIVSDQPGATMRIDDNFDRSWRRVGLALDHGGFTVEDRDRAQGLYYVRYVDAKEAAKDEPGIFSKFTSWFGHQGPSPVNKYRISIKAPGDTATVTVLNDQGQPDKSENAQRIVSLLVDELK